MGQKPERGTFDHIKWMTAKIKEAAAHLEVPTHTLTREAFLLFCEDATRTDTDKYGWAEIKKMAVGSIPPKGITGPVAQEDLPFPSVPEDYYTRQVSTRTDKDGNILQQSVQARVTQAPGSLGERIPEGHVVKGVSTLVSGDGRTIQQWTKTAEAKESREDCLIRLLKDLPDHIVPREGLIPSPTDTKSTDCLAVYPMGDPHIGMLSWAPETGDNFDLEIAQRITRNAIDNLVERGTPCEEALVINLGDYFHSDNADNRTARSGHSLDVDGRWARVLRVGVDLMIYTIDATLRKHSKVRVISEIGNHDDHSAVVLALALDVYYRNEPRVTIDVSPAAHHKFRFGKCLIGVTHGHQTKGPKLPLFMAAKWPQDWGETKHRFWYVGHVHHKDVKEYNGCVVEHFRTLAAKDAWHSASGYDSGRDMNRITLHREWGEIERSTVSADYLEAQYRREVLDEY